MTGRKPKVRIVCVICGGDYYRWEWPARIMAPVCGKPHCYSMYRKVLRAERAAYLAAELAQNPFRRIKNPGSAMPGYPDGV